MRERKRGKKKNGREKIYICIYQIDVFVFDFLKADTAHVGRWSSVVVAIRIEVAIEGEIKMVVGAVPYGVLYICNIVGMAL